MEILELFKSNHTTINKGNAKLILQYLTDLKEGDFTQRLPLDQQGVTGQIFQTINDLTERINYLDQGILHIDPFSNEAESATLPTRTKPEFGLWAERLEHVQTTIEDIVQPTMEIARVIEAVANGDLSSKVNYEQNNALHKNRFNKLTVTINALLKRLNNFANEVSRVAREVGTEGKLGGQAKVDDVSGVWRDLTDNVNMMANNLTGQVRNIAEVTTAVAQGDLSRKITIDAKGEILELKITVNNMVEKLNSFSNEVTRVAREVGSEGSLGGQAKVEGVFGVWRNLTDNVNMMANNLTGQVRNIAEVTTAVAQGDLSKKITIEARGEIHELKGTINNMVEKLNSFSGEVTRVAREVGTQGILGGQAKVEGVSGVWRDLTDNVNMMANNLTEQVRNIAQVTTAVAQGDLSKKITIEARGEILELKKTINVMVEQLNRFGDEVSRVAREVGTEGKLGGQAKVEGVSGVWRDLTDNVNMMGNNLTEQVRNIARVTTAVAQGDLSKKITIQAQGEILELKDTINVMVEELNSFSDEVTRVAREVGTEGKLGGQAKVEGVSGVWRDLTDSVNMMGNNLTEQVRNIALVTTAVAQGDLSKKITIEAKGEILELKDTVNEMVEKLNSFSDEVTRVAREVGTDGKLGGQAKVEGVSGVWRDLTDSVNMMGNNLTEQVRNIALVTTAVAQGDLSKKITIEAKGEIRELKDIINVMVEKLNSFSDEVTRVSREVGTEGKLGGQAKVQGVSGVWRDLTDNVNMMANNLTEQVRNIAEVTTAVAQGDLSKKITIKAQGEIQELKDTINVMVDRLNGFAAEVTRVAREVGTEGKLGGQANVLNVSGTWRALTNNVNQMASNLTEQVRGISKVVTAVANGFLNKKLTLSASGEIAELAETINDMIDTLAIFAEQVTLVAFEVGTEGKLGGQAIVPGAKGIWLDLTGNVNLMASNLTDQVRGIAKVVNAIAEGDLSQKLTLNAKGEIADLAETANNLMLLLEIFSDQVNMVAREVGVEGKLGGQASVPLAEGRWRELTNNVNQLANNLTVQVRAIGEVVTAVTKGDLSRSITVDAKAELQDLKDNINTMIATLRDTTSANTEQDWLKTNLTRFTRLIQGQRQLTLVANIVLSELAPLVEAQHGAFYLNETIEDTTSLEENDSGFKLIGSYAYQNRKKLTNSFKLGEGLIGQCALEKKSILLTNVPTDYIQINSGLGEANPLNIIVLPILFETEVLGVIELASFTAFSEIQTNFLDELSESMGIVLNTVGASMRTETLLQESQNMSKELQAQQTELEQSNASLEHQTQQLEERNNEVESKNAQVELARGELEQKAHQLELTSKYKSEFLTNMSHELRTPLNSLLILSQLLAENKGKNLSPKQVEYAETIGGSGRDLLSLINEILDLSKIESGAMAVEKSKLYFKDFSGNLKRLFAEMAEKNGLKFNVRMSKTLPKFVFTDSKRLLQILKNLLSNAFKFTEKGSVNLTVKTVKSGWSKDQTVLNASKTVIAFEVKDTGIGIPLEKQQIIFEAFQQIDASTSRKYEGTGLGLSISREIAGLLNGELQLISSIPNKGSTFIFYLSADDEMSADNLVSQENSSNLTTFLTQESVKSNEEKEIINIYTEFVDTEQPIIQIKIKDDINNIQDGEALLLIIEDDEKFARTLLDMAHEKGFKAIIALNGESGIALARKYQPDAITLDIKLPTINGWNVLDLLKHEPQTRHIPVHIISVEFEKIRAFRQGALGVLPKPVTKENLEKVFEKMIGHKDRTKKLLIIEDDAKLRKSVIELIAGEDIQVTEAATADEGIKAIQNTVFDCIILDFRLPDMDGFQLLKQINKETLFEIPVIVYTGKELSKKEETEIRQIAETIILKDVRSPERLLEETTLFLHRVESALPEEKRQLLEKAQEHEEGLAGKKILIIDDDIRNLFALTALLEHHDIQVVITEDGKEGLSKLAENKDIDMILTDIMMPEMDGYEVIRKVRANSKYKKLPIIALTAKAMKGDREKCINVGASDYITKPVNNEQLLSLLRVWLYKS
jgi:HAMP domain-containing protein/CheY-like chemotaxis protein/signal transduction histidine kinase